MFRNLVLLLGYSLARAAEDSDEGTLFQGASRLRLHTDSLADAEKSFAILQGSDGIQILQSVKNLANTANKLHQRNDNDTDGVDSQSFATAVSAVSTAISTALSTLNTENTNSQNAINIVHEMLMGCSSNQESGQARIQSLRTERDLQHTAHKSCRVGQETLWDENKTACDALSKTIRQLAGSTTNCAITSEANTDSNRGDIREVLDAMNDFVNDYRQTFINEVTTCENAETAYKERRTCATVQKQFETEYCAHRTACSDFDSCWVNLEPKLEEVNKNEQSSLQLRQSQFQALNQAECILGHIAASVTSHEEITDAVLAPCDADVSTHADWPDLSFPDPTRPTVDCPMEESPTACSQAFLEEQYYEDVTAQWQRSEVDAACVHCPLPEPEDSVLFPEPEPEPEPSEDQGQVFFKNFIGAVNFIGTFDDTVAVTHGDHFLQRIDCTSRVIQARVEGETCGGEATVQFRVNAAVARYFRDGTPPQNTFEDIEDVTVVSGEVQVMPRWIGIFPRGRDDKGWMLADLRRVNYGAFASSGAMSFSEYCNNRAIGTSEALVTLTCMPV